MARKDVFKGTLEALINPPARPAAKSILQPAALGAVESGLARGLQLLDLDPDQIAQSEFEDRLPYDAAALTDLVESIRTHGQQIPILVQRGAAGAYRVIYGRRRLAAVRALGLKVRALVTTMDDDQRIIAQGIENTVRQDLSFIEKAMFAHRLREAGIADGTIRSALNIDVDAPKATTISTMKMVVDTLGDDLILAIGRAPGIGRPRWRSLAENFRDQSTRFAGENREALLADIVAPLHGVDQDDDESDLRFKRAMDLIAPHPERPPAPLRQSSKQDSAKIAEITATRSAFSVTVKAKTNPSFHAWLVDHADALVAGWHDQWLAENSSNPKPEAR